MMNIDEVYIWKIYMKLTDIEKGLKELPLNNKLSSNFVEIF